MWCITKSGSLLTSLVILERSIKATMQLIMLSALVMSISRLKIEDSGVHVLKDVRHVPRLQKNIISLGDLHGSGYVF